MSNQEKRTVVLNTIFNFASVLATLFLNIYLYSYTGSLLIMSIYTIIRIGLFPLFFVWGLKITRKIPFVFTFSIGLFLMSLSLMFALVGGKIFEINNLYVLIVAAISGMGEGFYWYSSNTLSQIVSIPETRAKFLSINGIFTNISSLLAPLLANLIIDFCPNDDMAYRYILGLVIVLYIFVIFVAQKLRLINKDKNISVLKTLSLKVDPVWAKHQLAVFLYGLKESLTLTLTGILVFNAVGSGGLYSKLQGIFAFITIISYRLLSRVLDKSKINKTFNIGTFITIISTLVLVLVPNIYEAIFFGITNALSTVFYLNSYSYLSANVISAYQDEMTTRVVAREIYLSIGRCTGMLIIVLAYLFLDESISLQAAVILLSITPVFVNRLLLSVKN